MRHIANVGGSDQSGNMRNVFQAASFERMVLIHDDDLMVPGGVDVLVLDYVATYRKSDVSILLTTSLDAHNGHFGRKALPDLDAMNALEREGLELTRRRMAPRAIEGYLAVRNLQAVAKILRQHFHHLDRSYRWRARILLRLAAAAIAQVRARL